MKQNKGMVLIIALIVMGIVLTLVGYFLQFVTVDYKIAKSAALAARTYYLTEAGITEAIWKTKNDAIWKNNFITDPQWSASINRTDVFETGSSYDVTVANTEVGNAGIDVEGHIANGANISQRLVKTNIFQALGQNASSTMAIFTDEDINLTAAVININGGGTFSGDDLLLNSASSLTMANHARAIDQITLGWGSAIEAEALESANNPPAPQNWPMPQVDFDSADPESLKNLATAIYTTGQFNQFINGAGTDKYLNGITYVTGNAIIPRGKILHVSGALVSDGHITVGNDWWPFWLANPSLYVTDPGSGPLGLFSKRKITFGAFSGTISIEGLIYAVDEFALDAYGLSLSLNGGIIARQMRVNSLWQSLNIINNAALVERAVTLPDESSPVINVDHWEEEY